MTDVKLLLLHSNTWNCVQKDMSLGSFKNMIKKMCLQIIYIYKKVRH